MSERIVIKEICEVYDGPHATPKKTVDGPVYLGIDAITDDGKINAKEFAHLSEEDYIKWTKRVTPQYGDIVFSYEATLGRYALIPKDFYGCLGRRLAIIRNVSKDIDTLWLYYYFLSPEWKQFIQSKIIKGSTVNRISVEDFPTYTVPNISIKVQRKIANILSKIDEKIALNNNINDNLSAMAYDIYMHTFFSKKPNAKLKDILTEAEKSAIQVGEAKTSNGEYPFFTSGATILKWNEPFVDGRNCFLNTGGNADVKFYVGKAAYSTDTWSISAKSEMSDYLYLMLFSIKPELDQKFFQGTGLKHLQKPLLKDRPIYIPEKMELEGFNRQVMPMFDIISENTRENQQLTSLRDWLLPMLMNGQTTISD
jgi:type I restriction enzyme, S subunit